MRSCDVFALPSIIEGRALVQQEAMSQGLPLIVTANAGGSDLIEAGETGFLTPIRSPESIAENIEWFLQHREELPRMAERAKSKARSYSWRAYAKAIIGFCLRECETKSV
jgi:glycosyltransferase involved in cell wall biosynthesis